MRAIQATTPTIPLHGWVYRLDGYPEIPEVPVKEFINSHARQAAAGDSHAALLIYLQVARCFRTLENEGTPDALLIDAQVLGGADAAIKQQEQRMEQCKDLNHSDYETHGEWLSLAADLGNPFAQLTYSFLPQVVLGPMASIIREPERIVEYKRKAIDHLEQLARSGNVNALDRLSQIYKDGFFIPADAVMAEAYLLAASRADPGIERRDTEQPAIPLDARQRADAARLAKEIYRECCESK